MQKIFCTIFSASLAIVSASAKEPETKSRPNVLFIIADDLNTELGCYGNPSIISPHIDALAARGVLFQNHFVQAATCGASRASMLTGRRPKTMVDLSNNAFEPFKKLRQEGVKPDINNPGSIITIPELFKANGYTTVAVGKVSNLADKGDMPGAWDIEESYLYQSKYPEQKMESGNLKERLPAKMIEAPDTFFTDGLVAQAAIGHLRKLKSKNKPFFMGVGFHLPHLPFYAPKKYWDFYDPKQIQLPQFTHAPDNCIGSISLHNNFELRGQYTQLDLDNPDMETRILRHGYYASTSFVDELIGKVIFELDHLGLRENTIIVLWGDNGFHLGEYGVWGKHTCFRNAMCTPLIIVDPRLKREGTVIREQSESLGIFPTLAELCHLPLPLSIEGQSLVSQMKHPSKHGMKYITGNLPEGEWRSSEPLGLTLRTKRYLLVEWRDRKSNSPIDYVELYDHKNDPSETKNIASQFPGKVARLRKILKQKTIINN